MRRLLSHLALALPLLGAGVAPLHAATLFTPNFKIDVTPQCPEGTVGCDKVEYVGVSKNTGQQIKLMGKQVMRMCADGKTPCQSLGYRFKNGSTTYMLGEDGRLVVTQGRKVLVNEQGDWGN